MLAVREFKGVSDVLKHGQEHLDNNTARVNEDGTKSTFLGTVVNDARLNNGRATIVPTFWHGKQLDTSKPAERDAVITNAIKSGKTWPSGDSVAEALKLEQYVHSTYMEKQQ